MLQIAVHLYSQTEPELVAAQDEFSSEPLADGQPLPATAESIIQRVCKHLRIPPACQLLFALLQRSTRLYLPGHHRVRAAESYEFRLRYQISQLADLKRMSAVAFDYMYQQFRCDLIAARIVGLEYPNHKDEVSGLCATLMYVDMLERGLSVDQVVADYKHYVPKKYVKMHSLFIKQKISKVLVPLQSKNYGPDYTKEVVINRINDLAPDYFKEQCDGLANFPDPEDRGETGAGADLRCPIRLEFAPFAAQRPGLSFYYSYRTHYKSVCSIDDLYTVVETGKRVQFLTRQQSSLNGGFEVDIESDAERASFISCICGYYRLMVKWIVCVCQDYQSPQLQRLLANRCHGPIGGQFAYNKLLKIRQEAGTYLLRQCESTWDRYYIDIIRRGVQPETFMVTNVHGLWQLIGVGQPGEVLEFGSLVELAKSIRCAGVNGGQKFRLSPSEYDKTSTLLICLPPEPLNVKKTLSELDKIELRKQLTHVLSPNDFIRYLNTARLTEDDTLEELRADWMLPDNKQLEVTLKVLRKPERLADFMQLADKWNRIKSPELVNMFGFTPCHPQMLVMESLRLGPLDELLRTESADRVPVGCLIDAAHSCARAVHYLHENQLVHGRVRCSKLKVVQFGPGLLVVRLGDPGFPRPFQPNDIAWTPQDNRHRSADTPLSQKDEIWALTTTMWEIFTRGFTPNADYHRKRRGNLPQPAECSMHLYAMMKQGWDPVPERRFTLQAIFSLFIEEKGRLAYASVERRNSVSGSINSADTTTTNGGCDRDSENSYVPNGGGTNANSRTSLVTLPMNGAGGGGQSPSTSMSEYPGSPDTDTTGLLSGDDWPATTSTPTNSASNEQQMIKFKKSKFDLNNGMAVELNKLIGQGFFGFVYSGLLHDDDKPDKRKPTPIAAKMFFSQHCNMDDCHREVEIMLRLRHPNVVRIISLLDSPLVIIMELVKHGSFIRYLSSHAPTLTMLRLLRFARDIASGMEYLVSQQIVHRDLAARNVLVDADETVKISDFGLAQRTDQDGYYFMQTHRSMPISWHAPETLVSVNGILKYSHQSDVWSYGVTLWEIFSHGQEPELMKGAPLVPSQMLEVLEQGTRLSKPTHCTDAFYADVICRCWQMTPRDRPTFTQLIARLDVFIEEFGEVVD